MRFLSVCSGIEAASAAWGPLGWKAAAFSEIEAFPCAVLAHHYPDTPNLGDMTKYKDWPDDISIDLLCGGTPCQSFSVAGLRKGLDDPRGNLMLTFGAIAAKYRPQWLVWENVPGVLSSNGGRDFGSFLGMLGQLGYGFAYRVLDAQYFGVAQRRRRVFVVGCLGDWRSAAAVLFERHSLQGHPAPSRQAGQAVTGTLSARTEGGGGLGADFDCSGGVQPVVGTINANGKAAGSATQQDAESGMLVTTRTLRGEGFDASEDGTGRGTPLVPVCAEVAMTLTSGGTGARGRMDPVNTDLVLIHPCIAFPERMSGTQHASTENLAPSMGALNPTAVAVSLRGREGGATAELGDEVGNCLRASGGGGDKAHVLASMAVRRLTARECERLQGFSDDYTLIPGKRKNIRPEKLDHDYIKYLARGGVMTFEQCCNAAADGPRYKALGNSWAVPNVRWIGERIDAVALIKKAQKATNPTPERKVA